MSLPASQGLAVGRGGTFLVKPLVHHHLTQLPDKQNPAANFDPEKMDLRLFIKIKSLTHDGLPSPVERVQESWVEGGRGGGGARARAGGRLLRDGGRDRSVASLRVIPRSADLHWDCRNLGPSFPDIFVFVFQAFNLLVLLLRSGHDLHARPLPGVNNVSPVLGVRGGQFVPPLDNEDTGIADVSPSVFFHLETSLETGGVLVTCCKAGAERKGANYNSPGSLFSVLLPA